MKRIVCIIAAVLLSCALAMNISAEYSDADISDVSLGSAQDFLDDNGVDLSAPETIENVSAESILNYFIGIFRSALSRPAMILIIAAAFALICEVSLNVSSRSGINGEVFVIICFLSISPYILTSISDVLSAAKSQQAFMASYIPIFAGIIAASGNISGAASYNALVLYASEGIAITASLILKPILMCMLVMCCTQAINPDLPDITGCLRRIFTGIIGTVMTIFIGVIGLQTAVGRSGNEIMLRAGKYLVSSFVPIVGMSLSESYKAVKVSMSAIRTSVGTVGIVVMVVLLAVPIINMLVYKLMITLSEWICQLCGSDRLACLMRGLADVYSLCVTILLIYGTMFVLSTGIMIMMGSEV